MFNPSREQVRNFFIETWRKHQTKQLLMPQESITLRWMLEHPEYHALWSDPEALHRDFSPEQGTTNPFLHLSLHLAIEEQLSIDQPTGIRALYEQLRSRTETPHEAAHVVLDCLAEIIWEAQRYQTPPDNQRYLQLIKQRIIGR